MALGAAIVWAPLYLLVWLADTVGLLRVPELDGLQGLRGPYVRAALVSSYLVASAGLLVLHRRLRGEFGAVAALATSLLLAAGTSLAWYGLYEPAMAHAASFGLAALFVVGCDRWRNRVPPVSVAAATGVLFSLLVAVRPQDALFGIFLAATIASSVRNRASLSGQVSQLRWVAAGAAPLLLVQATMVALLMREQSFVLAGQDGYLHLLDSRWLDVLFSSRHGFLSWTPVAYVAVLGAVFYVRRDPVWSLSALAVLAGMTWLNGSTDDWWGGWAFGGRRFTSTLAALAPGLALAVLWVRERPMVVVTPLLAMALGWNYLLMQQYHHQQIPRDAPIGFDRVARQQLDLAIERMPGYPFAFPANIWFAWREGVPVDRYDLLAPEPLGSSFALVLDERSRRFLLNGWDEVDRDGSGSYVAARDEEASLVLPLDPPRAPPLTLEVEAGTGPSDRPIHVLMRVEVNGRIVGDAAVEPSPRTFTFAGDRPDLARNIWRTGYNRITFRKLRARTIAEDSWQPSSSDRAQHWPVAVYTVRVNPRPSGLAH